MARFGLTALRTATGVARSRAPGHAGPRALRGQRRALVPSARRGGDRRLRALAVGSRPRCRLAHRARRLTALCRCPGRAIPLARRGNRDRCPARDARGDTGRASRDPRPDTAASGANREEAAAVQVRLALERYRYGAAAFKLDWALDGPVPWRRRSAPAPQRYTSAGNAGGNRRIGGRAGQGTGPRRPFVLFVQPTLFDPSRAPDGKHTAWAYCHVPNGCALNLTDHIERQVERFAPGFRDRILARNVLTPADFERRNPTSSAATSTAGMMDLRQVFARPVARLNPYRTPAQRRLHLLRVHPAGWRGARAWVGITPRRRPREARPDR